MTAVTVFAYAAGAYLSVGALASFAFCAIAFPRPYSDWLHRVAVALAWATGALAWAPLLGLYVLEEIESKRRQRRIAEWQGRMRG